jgi:hypothetical protein
MGKMLPQANVAAREIGDWPKALDYSAFRSYWITQ